MKISVFIATSLDGFIARPDGSLDWLPGAEPAANGAELEMTNNGESAEDHGWSAFWQSVDCLVMGRKSFEKVMDFGLWPYENKRVIVLSTTMAAVPAELRGKAEIFADDPWKLSDMLAFAGYARIYIDGGRTIQSFLRLGLVTDLTITTIPVLIGQGIPLFGPLPADIPLRHVKTKSYPNGFVQSVYETKPTN